MSTFELWNINRWLRYTGFRLYVLIDIDAIKLFGEPKEPTRIGIGFYGWKNL